MLRFSLRIFFEKSSFKPGLMLERCFIAISNRIVCSNVTPSRQETSHSFPKTGVIKKSLHIILRTSCRKGHSSAV